MCVCVCVCVCVVCVFVYVSEFKLGSGLGFGVQGRGSQALGIARRSPVWLGSGLVKVKDWFRFVTISDVELQAFPSDDPQMWLEFSITRVSAAIRDWGFGSGLGFRTHRPLLLRADVPHDAFLLCLPRPQRLALHVGAVLGLRRTTDEIPSPRPIKIHCST